MRRLLMMIGFIALCLGIWSLVGAANGRAVHVAFATDVSRLA